MIHRIGLKSKSEQNDAEKDALSAVDVAVRKMVWGAEPKMSPEKIEALEAAMSKVPREVLGNAINKIMTWGFNFCRQDLIELGLSFDTGALATPGVGRMFTSDTDNLITVREATFRRDLNDVPSYHIQVLKEACKTHGQAFEYDLIETALRDLDYRTLESPKNEGDAANILKATMLNLINLKHILSDRAFQDTYIGNTIVDRLVVSKRAELLEVYPDFLNFMAETVRMDAPRCREKLTRLGSLSEQTFRAVSRMVTEGWQDLVADGLQESAEREMYSVLEDKPVAVLRFLNGLEVAPATRALNDNMLRIILTGDWMDADNLSMAVETGFVEEFNALISSISRNPLLLDRAMRVRGLYEHDLSNVEVTVPYMLTRAALAANGKPIGLPKGRRGGYGESVYNCSKMAGSKAFARFLPEVVEEAKQIIKTAVAYDVELRYKRLEANPELGLKPFAEVSLETAMAEVVTRMQIEEVASDLYGNYDKVPKREQAFFPFEHSNRGNGYGEIGNKNQRKFLLTLCDPAEVERVAMSNKLYQSVAGNLGILPKSFISKGPKSLLDRMNGPSKG